jgi:hypothetical protein
MELTEIQSPENRLPLPGGKVIDSTECLIESIWGHRLWHRQTPWLIFLEFLNVADSAATENVPFGNVTGEETFPANYKCRKRLFLRHLLFRNSNVDLLADKRWSDADLWTHWVDYFKGRLADSCAYDPGLLRGRFQKFTDFAAAVRLLRETVVHTSKRWTSSFVFPFGPAALYEDLDIKLQSDRGNFGRTGELLYMMLRRSGLAVKLQPLVSSFLKRDSANNRLLAKLQPEEDAQFGQDKSLGYLPYKQHPAFRRLAQDWLAISGLGLPGYDAYQHYATLASFHLLMYHVETAAAGMGDSNLFFVCEVLAPKMEAVRQLSIRSFQNNEGRSYAAVQAAWDRLLQHAEWRSIADPEAALPVDEQIAEALTFFIKHISLKPDRLPPAFSSISAFLEYLSELIERKLDDNVGLLHRSYGRDCGFVSKRGTRNYRYAPTDSFLKTLVLANVEQRMELRDFLRRLFDRYHLVLGPEEAERIKGNNDFEGTVFKKNAKRLEDRLKSMGMLNRLSDGVAFVENPIRSQ